MASVKKKILDQRSVHHLMQKGVFTKETRNVVCLLVKAGCSRNLVGEVISAVLKSAGITGVGSVARHVSRIKDVQRSVADYSHSPYLGCCVVEAC